MDLSHVLTAAVAVLVGVVGALRVIAPMTKNTVDDEVLERLEQLEAVVHSLGLDGQPASDAPKASDPAPPAAK